jgi:hypothetical protein
MILSCKFIYFNACSSLCGTEKSYYCNKNHSSINDRLITQCSTSYRVDINSIFEFSDSLILSNTRLCWGSCLSKHHCDYIVYSNCSSLEEIESIIEDILQ